MRIDIFIVQTLNILNPVLNIIEDHLIMNESKEEKFEVEDLYEVLTSTENVKEKLKPFVKQFKYKNMPFIYDTIVHLIQILTGKHQLPLMKFNALMTVKIIFDTAQYVATTLIEVYLLPIILDIANYRIQKRSEEGLTLYFIERGYDSTKQMKRIGFNYVLLAIEFIFMAALVKPYRTIQNQELRKQRSNYQKIVLLLKEKGLKPIEKYKFYIPSYVNQTRKKYLKRLSRFQHEDYAEFMIRMICDEINLNKKPALDLKKMLVYGDAYLTIPLMNICQDELLNMGTNNFVNKKKYLSFLYDFVRWGDVYGIIVINDSDFIEEIYYKITKIRGDLGLEYGDSIYPQIQATKSDKKDFYIQFLKCIEMWAYCIPIDQQNQFTPAKKVYDILKTQRKFIFPVNILLSKIKSQIDANLKQNNQRNIKLLAFLENDISSSTTKKRFMNNSFHNSKEGSKLSKRSQKNRINSVESYLQCDDLEQIMLQGKKKIHEITRNNNKLKANIEYLKEFKKNWRQNVERLEVDGQEAGDIEIIFQEGDLCCQQILLILPAYELYEKNAITFQEFKEKIQLIILRVEDQNQNSISEELKSIHIRDQQESNQRDIQNHDKFYQNHQNKRNIQNHVDIHQQNNDYQFYTTENFLKNHQVKANNSDIKFSNQKSKKNDLISQSFESQKSSQIFKQKVKYQDKYNKNNEKQNLRLSNVSKTSQKIANFQKEPIHEDIFQQQNPYKLMRQSRDNEKQDSLHASLKQNSLDASPKQKKQKGTPNFKGIDSEISMEEQKIMDEKQSDNNMNQDYNSQIKSSHSRLSKGRRGQSKLSHSRLSNSSQERSTQKSRRNYINQRQLQPDHKNYQDVFNQNVKAKMNNDYYDNKQSYISSQPSYQKIHQKNDSRLNEQEQNQSKSVQKILRHENSKGSKLLKLQINENMSIKIDPQSQFYQNSKAKSKTENQNIKDSKINQIHEDYLMQPMKNKNYQNRIKKSLMLKKTSSIQQNSSDNQSNGENLRKSKSKSKISSLLQKNRSKNKEYGNEREESSIIRNENENRDNYQGHSRYENIELKQKMMKDKMRRQRREAENNDISQLSNNSNRKNNGPEKEKYLNNDQAKDSEVSAQHSMVLNYMLDDSDYIKEPQENPLLHSFHGNNQTLSLISDNKVLSFKECFNVNQEIIFSKEKQQKLLSFTSTGKIKNFISTHNSQRSMRSTNIVDYLSQKNAKNSIENYKIERQKSKIAESLNEKARSMESFNKNLKMKYFVQKQQSNSNKSKQIMKFSVNNGSQVNSIFSGMQSLKEKSQGEAINYKNSQNFYHNKGEMNENNSKLINNSIYTHYFPKINNDKIKKTLLRNKNLILKNEDFQIGAVSSKRQKYVDISLFLTPLRESICQLTFSIIKDQNMTIHLNNEQTHRVKVRQQEHINLQCFLEGVPYVLPTLICKFKTESSGEYGQLNIVIPCSFNKYFIYYPITQNYANNGQQSLQSNQVRIQEFQINTKMFSDQKIKQYFQNFSIIQKDKKVCVLMSEVYFKGQIYLLRFVIKAKGIALLEGKNMTGDHKNNKFIQFLLITYREILIAIHK